MPTANGRFDVVLKGGQVIDPSRTMDQRQDVAIRDGHIAVVADRIDGDAARVIDVKGLLVVPGLVDLHTHVYWGGTWSGVRADQSGQAGTTTFVDAGSSGAGNFEGFLEHVIAPSPARILAFLNVSFSGLIGALGRVDFPEAGDVRLLNVAEAVRIARKHPGLIRGIKVRLGRHGSGSLSTTALQLALEAAGMLGLPVMAHIDDPPPRVAEVLRILRPGDVLTHAFRRPPNSLLTRDGRVLEEALEARSRGVLFDIGHGYLMLSLEVARRLIDQGFPPDTISTDIYRVSMARPDLSLVQVLSKFMALGMSLHDTIRAATEVPVRILGKRNELGTLAPGFRADISVLNLIEGQFRFRGVPEAVLAIDGEDRDVEEQPGTSMLQPVYTIVGGRVLEDTTEREPARL